MVGRLLVGFVWLNRQFSVSWLVDIQWGSCGSIFSFLCHGWQTFSGVAVVLSLVFCVMVGRLLVGFVWFYLQFCASWQVDFCGVRVAQSLVFCVMVGRLLVGFVWLNLQFSVSWLVDFQWGSCGSIFCFLCHGWQTFSGVRVAQSVVSCAMVGRLLWGLCGSIFSFLRHGRQTFSGVRVAQSLVFCVMVGRLLVGFVWLNLQFSVSWLVDFQWGSCGSLFSFLCHGWQTFSGIRVAQPLVFCVMVGRLLVGFVWFYLQFSVSWLVDFQWGSCGSIFSFVFHGRQIFVGFNLQFSVSWLVEFQCDQCGSIFSFLRHGRQTFSGVPVTQSLVFGVMVGRLLVGFVWLNLQFSVSWLVDFYWGSCDSIFRFLCHGWQTFSGVRVAQSLDFCVMVGRILVGFVWLNLQFSVSWLEDFQWGSCGSIFSFLCHGRQTFSGVRATLSLGFCVMVGRLLVGFVWLNLQISVSWQVEFQWGLFGSIFSFLCHGWQTFSGVRVAQSLFFCVMVGRLLVGFAWLNLQFSVSWLVDFQWGSCGSIVSFLCHGRQIFSRFRVTQSSFLCHGWQTFSGVRVAQSLVLCHGRQTFSGVRVAQSLVFCVMVDRLLVGFVWFNLQFSVSWQVDFQWGSCGSIFSFVSWQVDFQWGSCGSIFSFLCHGWQTFSGVRVAQTLVFCVMVGRLLVGFVWLNLQFSVSWLVDVQWGSCGSIFSFVFYGRQTFVGFVWLNLQFSVSWLVDFQWGSCGSNFSFLCHGWQTFSGIRVAQPLVFCVMVG